MTARCAICQRSYDVAAWRRLSLLETLEPRAIRDHVTEWPNSVVIEVRACTCGRTLAKKLDASARA